MKTKTLFLFATIILSGCGKDFLNKLGNEKLVIPRTLEDMQAFLDNDVVMNGVTIAGGCPLPVLGEASTDDFYLTEHDYNSNLGQSWRSLYTWDKSYTYESQSIRNWTLPYTSIFYANNALDGLTKIERTAKNAEIWDNVRGSGLFYKAHIIFQLAQYFAPHYDVKNENTAYGIPLRLESDISVKVNRPTIKQTYNQVFADLNEAARLLPDTPAFKTRPSKHACYALLARIHLIRGAYREAAEFAARCLDIRNHLLDYNGLELEKMYPIPKLNEEVIFHINMERHPIMGLGIVNPLLFDKYEPADIRKLAFFNPDGTYRGSYDGTYGLFGGLTTSEVYLIRAEALARIGELGDAINDINNLRKHRISSDSYHPILISEVDDVLSLVLEERRKEMVFRGTSWSDLRRLNLEPEFARTLTRTINGQEYALPPNDSRYVFLIPEETIKPTGMEQNSR